MKLYRDIEHDTMITEAELRESFEELRTSGETDCENFGQYVNECTGRHGALEEVKPMTVMQWLFTEHGYDEAVMIDADGNECEFWTDDDDKMKAHVLRVEDRDAYGCTANVYTDYREARTVTE